MADDTKMQRFRSAVVRFSNVVFIRYVCLVFLLSTSTFIGSAIAYRHAHALSGEWASKLQPQLKLVDDPSKPFCVPQTPLHIKDEARLEQDYREIRSRMDHHLTVLCYFYANYFRAAWTGSILGALSGICLFYIANKGWANANNYVIVVFVFSTVFATFFLSYVTLFRQEENIADNKELYLQYVALGNQVLTYCATGASDDAGIADADKYLREVDARMAAINNIAVGFDYTKIPNYKELLSNDLQNEIGHEPSQSPGKK